MSMISLQARSIAVTLLFLAAIICSQPLTAADGFPGRERFPDVPIIEIKDLYQQLSDVVIIDARSNYEYETLRIKGAVNQPVANEDFEFRILDISHKTNKPLVFYCNGHTCMKSYIAAKKSMIAGVEKVYAFDAGIFDWARAYPKQAELLGRSPVDQKHLISQKEFKSRLLHPDRFSQFIINDKDKSIVVDVRDKYQRAGIGFYPGLERWASLDDREKLNRYIQRAKLENKTLYIYDEVGKQVRWLQYALEREGIKNYYFMEKGARAYYDMLAKIEWQ